MDIPKDPKRKMQKSEGPYMFPWENKVLLGTPGNRID